MSVAEKLTEIKNKLPNRVKLVAVSKTQSPEIILSAYNAGHAIFGENKVQELVDKQQKLPKDIEWHFIGHLQSNKVKYIAGFVHLIHGVDSLKLLKVIDKEAQKSEKIIKCLLQVKIAREETKFGLAEEDLVKILESEAFQGLQYISINGLMGMATFTTDKEVIRNEFRQLNAIFNKVKKDYYSDNEEFSELSMGMSHDYQIAVEEGATIVRLGSSIFGPRNYLNQ